MGARASKPTGAFTSVFLTPPPKPIIEPVEDDFDIPFLDLNIDADMSDALNRNFQELKSKNDEVRVKAAHDIRAAVVVAARGE